VQFLLILRGAHLVLDGKGKDLRVVFDMHLLDRDLGGRCGIVTVGVRREEGGERKLGILSACGFTTWAGRLGVG
jgi:hypothetical protein